MNQTNLPQRPQDMNACFAAAYNSGKAANMSRLFEPAAIVIGKNGETIAAAIDHENLLKLGGKMTSINKYHPAQLCRNQEIVRVNHKKQTKMFIWHNASMEKMDRKACSTNLRMLPSRALAFTSTSIVL